MRLFDWQGKQTGMRGKSAEMTAHRPHIALHIAVAHRPHIGGTNCHFELMTVTWKSSDPPLPSQLASTSTASTASTDPFAENPATMERLC